MSRAQELRAVDTSRDIMYSKAADARMSAAAYTLMLRGLPAVTPFSMASIKEMIEQPAMGRARTMCAGCEWSPERRTAGTCSGKR